MKNIIQQTPLNVLQNMIQFSLLYLKKEDVKNKNILDIGCGYGWFEIYARKQGAKSVTGTELSQADLFTAKKYVKDAHIRFTVGDATKLPFKDKTFDTVVSWEVIEHIPVGTEYIMLSEIARVLKKGGIGYISTPHRSLLGILSDPAFWLIAHRHYTTDEIRQFAKHAGLKVLDVRVIGSVWVSLYMLNLYIAKWIFRRQPFLQQYFLKKINTEFDNPSGYYNVYCRVKKV
jgi:SAM-dependent methyltransferase